jgi:hypothetical protein
MAKTYRCANAACPLGTFQKPGGLFVGGMTADGLHVLTGRPLESLEKGVDYGDGICTNCGTPGTEYTAEDAKKEALADAKAQYDAQVAAIKGGGA